ncbi:SpoIIE family protein phosphatase [Aurantivibrio plasticivorans]
MKILIVDDHRYNRELLAFMLDDHGYRYAQAENGQVAVDTYRDDPDIDLILMDINMPVMDGYAAAMAIKDIAKDNLIPILFVTALDDEETLARCLEIGGDDFVPKPVNENVLLAKIRAHERSVKLHNQLKASNESLSYHRRVMDREHKIVETVFSNGMQRMEQHCNNVNFHVSPMSMFNGDLLLISRSPLGGVYVLLGDFTGHGLSAAIGCLPVSDIFYAMAQKKAGIGHIAREINRKLQNILPPNMFFCASILELDRSGDRLTAWCGGMNDMLLLNQRGKIVRKVQSQHMPLGVLSDSEFEDSVELITPVSGLRIYSYTDGIVEAVNGTGEMYGEQRFISFLETTRGPSVDAISDEIERYHEGTAQTDDISLVEIIGKPVTFDGEIHGDNEKSKPICLPWNIVLKLTAEQLRNTNTIEQIVRLISSVQFAKDHRDVLFTIISELYNNSLEHGLLKLDSAIKNEEDGFSQYYQMRKALLDGLSDGELEIKIWVAENECLNIQLTDSGDGFDYSVMSNGAGDQLAHSRGLNLLMSLCENIYYSNGGRTVTVSYPLH